eukprot:CAMPEP_0194777492 /NCGR_PEP_ID=MMETSP0323_2-20130528/65775_1 /TAXON_ID=2866 ORGANISM="Crypthecodinium cohnii, Strain Seligo" /NCGR_SAMPLE_ID=MMETSP0323_2 /ASSEMBLY_ACC=CAM_ASM_000346 /LENGTH=138 /DNA_ID=CAMNT_0039714321 /DNA_START=108 /DNA_END=526 /DNA_ORIENTATION=-
MPRSCQMGAVTAFAPCRFRALAHRVSEATGLASLQHMPVDVVPYGLLIRGAFWGQKTGGQSALWQRRRRLRRETAATTLQDEEEEVEEAEEELCALGGRSLLGTSEDPKSVAGDFDRVGSIDRTNGPLARRELSDWPL